VDIDSIRRRSGWERISAVRHGCLHEVKGDEILSPGPGILLGLREIHEIVQRAMQE
jgi:hypothetical protein